MNQFYGDIKEEIHFSTLICCRSHSIQQAYNVASTFLSAGDVPVNKMERNLCLCGPLITLEYRDNQPSALSEPFRRQKCKSTASLLSVYISFTVHCGDPRLSSPPTFWLLCGFDQCQTMAVGRRVDVRYCSSCTSLLSVAGSQTVPSSWVSAIAGQPPS